MNYNELRSVIKEYSNTNFVLASNYLQEILFEIDKESLLSIIAEIGIIPEDIEHDSSEEKLYQGFRYIICKVSEGNEF